MSTPERLSKITVLLERQLKTYTDYHEIHEILLKTSAIKSEHLSRLSELKTANEKQQKSKERRMAKLSAQLEEIDEKMEILMGAIKNIEELFLLLEDKLL